MENICGGIHYSQTIILRFTVILFQSNLDRKVTRNEQKRTSNEQKVTSIEHKLKSNEQKVTSNESIIVYLNEVIRPLVLILPIMSGCVKMFKVKDGDNDKIPNLFLHLNQRINEKNHLMVFGLYQRWFRRQHKDFCEKLFFGEIW